MYIEPNSNIKIYHNVPLDNTYEHTLYFGSVSAQNTYFHTVPSSILKHNLTAQSYQRVKRGSMRVEVPAEQLYDCNYLAFQNTTFGNKWFYAFITSVEYVNNITSEITFDIDSWQTYFFDIHIMETFVEREHTMDDTVGRHTVPEPIDYGENVVQQSDNLYLGTPWKVIVHAVPNMARENVSDVDGSIVRNMYIAGKFYVKDLDADEINSLIDSLIVDGYKIENVYMCPSEFLDVETFDDEYFAPAFPRPSKYHDITPNSADEYEPHNNKLFTFPYCYMKVCNNQGSEMDLRWEFFRVNPDDTTMFRVRWSVLNSVTAELRPLYESGDRRYRTLAIDNFPICEWQDNASIQVIKQSFMQNAVLQNGIANAIQNYKNIGNVMKNAWKPAETSGNSSNGYLDVENSTFGWSFYSMGITPEYARIVDQFFDKYGYQTNRLKVPNISGRPVWNYVKTRDAVIKGNAPADDIKKLCATMNNGITFWKSPASVGNYSLNNTIS